MDTTHDKAAEEAAKIKDRADQTTERANLEQIELDATRAQAESPDAVHDRDEQASNGAGGE